MEFRIWMLLFLFWFDFFLNSIIQNISIYLYRVYSLFIFIFHRRFRLLHVIVIKHVVFLPVFPCDKTESADKQEVGYGNRTRVTLFRENKLHFLISFLKYKMLCAQKALNESVHATKYATPGQCLQSPHSANFLFYVNMRNYSLAVWVESVAQSRLSYAISLSTRTPLISFFVYTSFLLLHFCVRARMCCCR